VLSAFKHTLQTMFDEMSIRDISVRSLAVLRSLRTLENMTGQALLQIMPCSSWAVLCLLQNKCKYLLSNKYILFFYLIF
jgi:hypothetical protein